VTEEGGYDLVSDTKAKPLAWRKLAEEFIGKTPHLAAQAFMVKSAYYKNLVAYEIATHWGKEPPPKEILEDLTAKGGGVMSRSLDSFQRPSTRDGSLGHGNSSENEQQQESKDDDGEPGSVRSTRGLRHAPPQRVLFQPDTNLPRQTRNQGQTPASPSPAYASTTPMTLANYEPRQQLPLTLKPVTTPSNNPDYYRLKRKHQQEAQASDVAKKHKGLMLPGTGFIGPNIYVRAQLALQSGIPEEEEYALHHLVKISHERGDKYRFDQFAGLAEALINKMLQVSSLFYDIEWIISYEESTAPRTLDAINGTPDVLEKLQSAVQLDTDHDVEPAEFRQALGRITEAGLVVRNMVMLDENAQYIAKLPLLRDYFNILLNLRPHPSLVELQHYALETIEQLTKYYDLDATDLLYETMLAQLESNDRGKIITSLKAISRLGMTFEENKRLELVPLEIVQKLPEWMMLPDEELRSACLDFLFQYTSIADNVETLVLDADVQSLVRQLAHLLLYNAKKEVPKMPKPRVEEARYDSGQSAQVPRLCQEMIEQLLQYSEPDRSTRW
jgi:chromatin structure-remodeling complex subunit RSC9